MLMKNDGINRHDLGRDKFVEKVWEWKRDYGNKITSQLRSLGSSVDWSRERFTMDDMLNIADVKRNRMPERTLVSISFVSAHNLASAHRFRFV